MGLYSTRHHSLAEVKPGATVAVPNDPVNLERALKILQAVGWIRIRENPNPVDVSERDVVANLFPALARTLHGTRDALNPASVTGGTMR